LQTSGRQKYSFVRNCCKRILMLSFFLGHLLCSEVPIIQIWFASTITHLPNQAIQEPSQRLRMAAGVNPDALLGYVMALAAYHVNAQGPSELARHFANAYGTAT